MRASSKSRTEEATRRAAIVGGSIARSAFAHVVAMGIPPTGKKTATTFWDLHRFDETGLIVQTGNLMDSLTLMAQLGLLPSL